MLRKGSGSTGLEMNFLYQSVIEISIQLNELPIFTILTLFHESFNIYNALNFQQSLIFVLVSCSYKAHIPGIVILIYRGT